MHELFHRLLHLRRFPVWARYAISTGVVLMALAVRQGMGDLAADTPFLLFVPAVIVNAVAFDRGSGIYSAALSTALVAWFGQLETGSAPASLGAIIPLLLFLAITIAIAVLIEALHRAFHALAVSHTTLTTAFGQLERAEREKDVLLRELSHRTQNHLQTVSSLLHLQANRVTDPGAHAALVASAGRVQVIGRLHGRLTRTDGHVHVDISAFIADLCDDLRNSLVGAATIELIVLAESAEIRLARAVPVGLIINELVINALKHAFPDGRKGVIEVRFTQRDERYRLSVTDDGVGTAAALGSAGLGRQLVRALTDQLDGRLDLDAPGSGTRCAISFPVVAD